MEINELPSKANVLPSSPQATAGARYTVMDKMAEQGRRRGRVSSVYWASSQKSTRDVPWCLPSPPPATSKPLPGVHFWT
ncbi:hypothetical protein GW17_00015344 [Ensete ventricosum]|nr:hypothetical protein GW17_00015344 [Ensete ventricosum]